jgi:hypothetical protein
MLRDAGIEAIGGEIVLAAQQFELPGRDANVKDPLLGADRAVAFPHGRLLQVYADAKPHPAAMAAALVCLQHFPAPEPRECFSGRGYHFWEAQLTCDF